MYVVLVSCCPWLAAVVVILYIHRAILWFVASTWVIKETTTATKSVCVPSLLLTMMSGRWRRKVIRNGMLTIRHLYIENTSKIETKRAWSNCDQSTTLTFCDLVLKGSTQPRAPQPPPWRLSRPENILIFCLAIASCCGASLSSFICTYTVVLLTLQSYHCSDRNADEGLSSGLTWAHEFMFSHSTITWLNFFYQISMWVLC